MPRKKIAAGSVRIVKDLPAGHKISDDEPRTVPVDKQNLIPAVFGADTVPQLKQKRIPRLLAFRFRLLGLLFPDRIPGFFNRFLIIVGHFSVGIRKRPEENDLPRA
jgi:hypothetical protein